MNSINGHTDGYRGGYDASMHASEYADGRMDGFIPLSSSKEHMMTMNQKEIKQSFYLFFDTETTGLPKNWKAPLTDLANWPRMVQLAWLVYDADGNKVVGENAIIKPVGFEIPEAVAKIHGITTDKALSDGKPLEVVLALFRQRIEQAEVLVGHNISFDINIVGAEFVRLGIPPVTPPRRKICTMMSSTRYCNLPGPRGPKWPKLQELHNKLFSENFSEAHNAAADIDATARCFFELKRLGVIAV